MGAHIIALLLFCTGSYLVGLTCAAPCHGMPCCTVQVALGGKAKPGPHVVFAAREGGPKFAIGTLDAVRCPQFSCDLTFAMDEVSCGEWGVGCGAGMVRCWCGVEGVWAGVLWGEVGMVRCYSWPALGSLCWLADCT